MEPAPGPPGRNHLASRDPPGAPAGAQPTPERPLFLTSHSTGLLFLFLDFVGGQVLVGNRAREAEGQFTLREMEVASPGA